MQNKTSNITLLRLQALSILSVPHSFLDSDDFTPISTNLDPHSNSRQQIHDHNEENIEEQEFSFACTNSQERLAFADEIFENGKIRPTFHAFDQSFIFSNENNVAGSPLRAPLKKLFVEQQNSFCSKSSSISKELHNDPSENMTMVEVTTSKDNCKKSNSTGFSKSWRFRRDLKTRSNSDGGDAFVFLKPHIPEKHNEAKIENVPVKKGNGGKRKTTLSAHEKLYMMNKMRKETNRRKSFLPYKQNLVGLFSNVNMFSKNLHPF